MSTPSKKNSTAAKRHGRKEQFAGIRLTGLRRVAVKAGCVSITSKFPFGLRDHLTNLVKEITLMSSLLATDQKRKTLTPKHLEYAIDRINSRNSSGHSSLGAQFIGETAALLMKKTKKKKSKATEEEQTTV